MDPSARIRRRHVLAGIGSLASTTVAGCSERLWSRAEDTSSERVSLEIKTVPADDDLIAAQLSNRLTENFRDAGIDVNQTAIEEAELYNEVLNQRDFDVFVARHPGLEEPDTLRSFLHSDFVTERGWQNPFSFSDPLTDERLTEQTRKDGNDRRSTFEELFEHLLEMAPHTAVAYPDHVSAVRDTLTISKPPGRPDEFFTAVMNAPEDENEDEPAERPLRTGLFGQRNLSRLNPIVVDVTDVGVILELLYDPLYRRIDGEYVPWLAADSTWERTGGRLEATVSLRTNSQWHDGDVLDAEDVAFTIAFLKDTSLGESENPLPAPRYRGRQTLIDDVTVEGPRTVRLSFDGLSEEVAMWALTLPLLPQHIWDERATLIGEQRTDALAWDNDEPVGSGLFSFADFDGNEFFELDLFEDHALLESEVLDTSLDETPRFDGLEYRVLPNSGAAVDALIDDELDLIGDALPPDEFESIEDADDVRLVRRQTNSCYLIGYNMQHSTLGNPRFRTIASRLIDRQHAIAELFDGHARQAETPSSLVGIDPDQWEDTHPAPGFSFPGSDGEIDIERARELFSEAGYSYQDGELLE